MLALQDAVIVLPNVADFPVFASSELDYGGVAI